MTRSKTALGDLFVVCSSKRVLKSQWKNDGVPFYRGREITRLANDGFVDNELFISEELYAECAEKYGVPRAADIVITAIGTIGNSYIVREGDRFYFKDASVLWLKKKNEVSSEFINLWLKSPQFFDQLDTDNGATVDTLTIQKLQSVQVDLPPLPEQQRIVAFLDAAFDGIAVARANAEKNLQNARALFESHLQSVFTQRGDRWIEKTLGDVCEATQGVQIPKSEQSSTLLPGYRRYLYISDFESDKNLKYVRDAHPKKLVTPDDIIVANTGSAGKIFRGIDGILSNNLFKVSFDPAMVDRDYIFFFVTSGCFREYQQSIMRGTANPHMGHVNFKSTPISIPDIEIQKSLVEKIHEFAEETQRLESLYQRKLAALDELKKSLLHQAFSGML